MHLVANGCSHTAGAEIEFPMQGKCYDKAWPKHLADLWGYDYTNLSISGGSQKRIIRTTIEFIGNYKKTDNIQKVSFYKREIAVISDVENIKFNLSKNLNNYYKMGEINFKFNDQTDKHLLNHPNKNKATNTAAEMKKQIIYLMLIS